MGESEALEFGFVIFGALTSVVVLVLMCFRLGLTVFDYFGIRAGQ